jgi:transposase-like protein
VEIKSPRARPSPTSSAAAAAIKNVTKAASQELPRYVYMLYISQQQQHRQTIKKEKYICMSTIYTFRAESSGDRIL